MKDFPFDADGKLVTLSDAEKYIVKHAYGYHKGNITKIASDLGVSRTTAYRLLKSCGMSVVTVRSHEWSV